MPAEAGRSSAGAARAFPDTAHESLPPAAASAATPKTGATRKSLILFLRQLIESCGKISGASGKESNPGASRIDQKPTETDAPRGFLRNPLPPGRSLRSLPQGYR